MKDNCRKYIPLIALSLAVAVGTASAQQQNGTGTVSLGEASTVEATDLVFMREEEKLARDSYMVLGEKWELAIFDNISKSEQRHMDALKVLLDGFGIVDPIVDESDVGTFADPALQTMFDDLMVSGSESVMEALKVGGAIEETDILDLQETIDRSENEYIISAYENLLCGSRNHLRAFVRQVEFYGEVYSPILMSQDELSAIVDFPIERGCGAGAGKQGNGSNKGTGSCTGDGSGNGNPNGNGGNGNSGQGSGNGGNGGNGGSGKKG